MLIGVDASCWANRRGYGRFTRELMRALLKIDAVNRYLFFIDAESAEQCSFPERAEVVVVETSRAATKAASSSGHRSIKDMLLMAKAVARHRPDIFFYPSVYTYFPLLSGAKKVVAIHDVIPERLPRLVFPNARRRLFWRTKVWLALRQADEVMTVSEHSRQGIAEYFGFDPRRIKVVYEAADEIFKPVEDNAAEHLAVLGRYGIGPGERFFLYVGGIGPHKNLGSLISAFARLLERTGSSDLKLVIAGDVDSDPFWREAGLVEKAAESAPANKISFPGYVPDDDLVHLYSAAEALVMPSFAEGFGLPAVEAMACGTAVIGSRTTSLPEVVRDAGLFFEPSDAAELTDCMARIIADSALKQALKLRSRQIAASYSWEESARRALAIFSEVSSGR